MAFKYPHIANTRLRSRQHTAEFDLQHIKAALRNQTPPEIGSKNIFAFWHTGLDTIPPYLLRNIAGWYHQLAHLGWSIYVFDNVQDSNLNIRNFLDTTSDKVMPSAFNQDGLSGEYSAQHTSDLIRYPLLLQYGGVYLDVGIMQFGDLDWLWTQHITNNQSSIDFAGFTLGDPPESITICNFALICGPNNPLVETAHKILLKLWQGKTSTTGMHKHPLVNHIELMHVPAEVVIEEEGKEKMVTNDESMTDYAIQIQCMGAAQRWEDPEGWNGPEYVRKHCWLLSMISGAMQFEQLANWNGQRSFDLLSQQVVFENESEDEKLARQIVEDTVSKGWILKLGHGFSAKLFGFDTLGMIWRKRVGSDCVDGTYAGWLRWAHSNLQQINPPQPLQIPAYQSTRVAKLSEYL